MKSNWEKHVATCPHCHKQVLDHMTECPFCQGELTPRGYDPAHRQALQPARKAVRVVLWCVAAAVALWALASRFLR